MIAIWACALASALGAGAPSETTTERLPKGRLVIDGGGQPSAAVIKRTLALAGGPKTKIVIIPQASNLPGSGAKVALRWLQLGADNPAILDLTDPAAAVEMIRHADLIWIGGGDQERLMGRLKGTGVPEAIRARYHEGATIGGASAGAAVMSKTMIARGVEGYNKPLANFPLFGEGLGLWPGVIVDQHFLKRKRTDRLKRAVAEYPDQVGVGIDESTAVIVNGRSFEVVGESSVTVVDSRAPDPKIPAAKVLTSGGGDGAPPAEVPTGVKTATVNPGMIYDLDRGIIPDQVAEKR
ncbi:MAG: cphB 1 [Planctomycetota bacterium]|nr:cphB 1 [Planctomycetota bacterium]